MESEKVRLAEVYDNYYSTVDCSSLSKENLARKHVTEAIKAIINKNILNVAASQSSAIKCRSS